MSAAVQKVPTFILAGGKSSRFGQDKARALIHETPLILHVARAVEPFASTLRVVADRPGKYDDLGLETIVDHRGGCGPMSGLHRALDESPGDDWLLLASCDIHGLQSRWLKQLLEACDPEANAVAFKDQRWLPLPALYRATLGEQVQLMMEQERFALWSLLEQIRSVPVAVPEDWDRAVHINTRGDLMRLKGEPTWQSRPSRRPL